VLCYDSARMKRLAIVAAVYVVLCLAGGVAVAERAVHRAVRQPITVTDRAAAADLARTLGAGLESVSLSAGDGAALRGWLFSPSRPNTHSVLLLHGITSNRAAMIGAARLFLAAGYRALAVDLRAHGDSDGEFGVSGLLEADDARRWIAWLRNGRPDACAYAFGISLGAGIAVQAADAPGLCAVVAVSVFESLRETVFDRIGDQLHTGPWAGRTVLRPGVELGFLYLHVRYGVDPTASAADAAAGPGAPILLIHGIEDDNTPVRHAQSIHAVNPARVSLWLVPGATHRNMGQVAGPAYSIRILDFLANNQGAR
jgi:pimeloyl-ACP methyl ester carboxylesterase